MPSPSRPSLEEAREWPATVNVAPAAGLLGVSRSTAYEAIKAGTFPARTIQVGSRIVVVTASLLEVVGASALSSGGSAA